VITKSTIGHDQDFDVGWERFGQPNQYPIFISITVVLQGILVNG
jgi:hypothetical protein